MSKSVGQRGTVRSMEYVIREFLVYRVTDYSGTSGSGTYLV